MSVRGLSRIFLQWFEFMDSNENKRSDAPVIHEFGGPNDSRGTYEWTDGTDAITKADIFYTDRRTVSASGTSTIDLGTGGGLVDSYGNSITLFAEVVEILIYNRNSTAGQYVQFGPHTSTGFADPFGGTNPLVEIHPGDPLYMRNRSGWVVADGSADFLRIVNPGLVDVEVDIFILGRSA